MRLVQRELPERVKSIGGTIYIFDIVTEAGDAWNGSSYIPTLNGNSQFLIPSYFSRRTYQINNLFTDVVVSIQRSADGTNFVNTTTLNTNNSLVIVDGENAPLFRFSVTLPNNTSPPPAGTVIATVCIIAT